MTHASMAAQILAALPLAPAEVTAKQIHARVGLWAYVTVKHTLYKLVKSGEVIKGGDFDSPTFRRAR